MIILAQYIFICPLFLISQQVLVFQTSFQIQNYINKNFKEQMFSHWMWQIPTATILGWGAFYFGSILSTRKQPKNICSFAGSVLFFGSILITLPEVHIRAIQLFKKSRGTEFVQQQDEIMPISFLGVAIVFTFCLLLDKIILRRKVSFGNEQRHTQKSFQHLRYFIPVGASFLLFNNFFYNTKDKNNFSQFTISVLSCILINVSQGCIFSWTGPKSSSKRYTAFFTNILPITMGLTLGVLQHHLLQLSFLGIIGCGVTLYTITMLLFPLIMNDHHENIISQFLCIVGGFFINLLYYPAIHLMRV